MIGERLPRASAKKEQIASAARDLFLAQGYAGTTMDSVKAAAGVSKQTLYSYFPSKADLLAEVLREEIESLRMGGVSVPHAGSVPEFREALLEFARRLTVQWSRDDAQQLLRLAVGEVMRLPELRDVVREAFPGQLLGQVEELIRAAIRAGLIVAPRPDLSARMFLGPVMSFVVLDGMFRADGVLPPDSESLSYVVDAFLASVRIGVTC